MDKFYTDNIYVLIKDNDERNRFESYISKVNVNYDFVGWTTYIEQMNVLVEAFSDQHNRYWGDNTSYRFLCSIGGGINDAVQLGTNTGRQVRVTFTVSLKGYLLPEVIANIINKRRFNASKTNTKRKLVISEKIQ